MKYLDGKNYVGEVLNGKPLGQGTYTFSNEDQYKGEFLNGKEHGKGAYNQPDQTKHVGEWRNNLPWNG